MNISEMTAEERAALQHRADEDNAMWYHALALQPELSGQIMGRSPGCPWSARCHNPEPHKPEQCEGNNHDSI